MMTQRTRFAKSDELVQAAEQLNDFIHQAAADGLAAHEMEKGIWKIALCIGRLAFQRFLDVSGSGDLGESVELPDGKRVNRLREPRTRDYMSVFGEFQIHRYVYGSREGQKIDFVPLDTRLQLPESKFSFLLQDWDQLAATEEPYQKVSNFLERILGLKQHVDSLERMSRKMTDDAEAFCWSREAPPVEEEGELIVETADGKGVPIRRGADVPVIHDHAPKRGPKPDRKKMATLAAVYTVDRFVRTPEEVVDALFRKPGEPRPSWDRPRPCHRHVFAALNHENSAGDFVDGQAAAFGWMTEEIAARNPDGSQETVFITDGQESLRTTKEYFQDDISTIDVLDLLHVTPRLWQLGKMFHVPDARKAERYVRKQVLRILQGKTTGVVTGIRRMIRQQALTRSQREEAVKICQYFQKNAGRMRYDKYLRRGYPIASGVIEGACRHVVKDRLERSGMSWTVAGAQAMLLLRSIFTTDQWGDFMAYRIERETARLHPYRNLVQSVHWSVAA